MASYLYSVNVIIAGIFITCSQVKFTFQKDVPYLVKDGGSNEDEIFTSLNKRQISNLSSAPFRTNGKIDITTTKYINIPQDSENVIIRNHGYYTSKVMTKTPDFNEYWNDLKNTKGYMTLIRGSYPISMKADLKFKFRFYGNNITKIILTSSGFLYMGQFIHNNLQDTQYTAPLMAMFEAEDSNILYKDFGDKFVLEWQDVYLPDKNDTKPFHFQTTLHANGTIYFAYKQVPVDLFDIDMKNHPVKVGLSDAYYIDVIAGGVIRRTVHEYNRIDIDFKLVRTGTVVILDPLKSRLFFFCFGE
ncbi:plexin domain-containing protein 1-like [Saccostrea cucullata]|uniref:plexin domain-containing protein 1-like n=1 Tax=Saccostrea cuccullata TaxID=36930 RepID=UPI002ED08346